MIHELKIFSNFFEKVLYGDKTFEIRKNDRNFKEGDVVILNEIDGCYGGKGYEYSGCKLTATIGFLTDFEQKDGYVVFSLLNVRDVIIM